MGRILKNCLRIDLVCSSDYNIIDEFFDGQYFDRFPRYAGFRRRTGLSQAGLWGHQAAAIRNGKISKDESF